MLFNSLIYIAVFLPIVTVIFFYLNRKRLGTAAKAWLVLSSLFFYGYWNPRYLLLIISSMLVNFSLGAELNRINRGDQGQTMVLVRRRFILLLGIVFNLIMLGYFKYTDFFIDVLNHAFSTEISLPGIVLPLAISFFTFQQLAYLMDSYQGFTREYDFLNYCLFVPFFPQLIAGPIVHHREMMPQFVRARNRLVNWDNINLGLYVFFIGLFKKVMIADAFSVWANAGFKSQAALSLFEAWGASLSFTLQLYYDFSGYSDMAVGAALLFNIRLPINFNSPYKALSIQDFWRRWHMTLSRWLRDYLYIPLGGNRKGERATVINMFITFLLGGLWHGAGWTFIVWGAVHGAMQIVHRGWRRLGMRLPVPVSWLVTFLLVNASWVLFKANTLVDAVRVLKGMAGLHGVVFAAHFPSCNIRSIGYTVVFAGLAFLLPNSMQSIGFLPYRGLLRFRPNVFFVVFTALIAAIGITGMIMTKGTEFLYFNF